MRAPTDYINKAPPPYVRAYWYCALLYLYIDEVDGMKTRIAGLISQLAWRPFGIEQELYT